MHEGCGDEKRCARANTDRGRGSRKKVRGVANSQCLSEVEQESEGLNDHPLQLLANFSLSYASKVSNLRYRLPRDPCSFPTQAVIPILLTLGGETIPFNSL